MHKVELFEEAIVLARRLGYRSRQEWLGGSGGGACEIKGQKWIFIDLALSPNEQLELVIEALVGEDSLRLCEVSVDLAKLLKVRKTA